MNFGVATLLSTVRLRSTRRGPWLAYHTSYTICNHGAIWSFRVWSLVRFQESKKKKKNPTQPANRGCCLLSPRHSTQPAELCARLVFMWSMKQPQPQLLFMTVEVEAAVFTQNHIHNNSSYIRPVLWLCLGLGCMQLLQMANVTAATSPLSSITLICQ